MMHKPVRMLLVVIVLLADFEAAAQDGAKEKFAQAQKQNAALLRQYSWTSRTELKLKGESKNVKMESVRYDANGQLQKTPLDSPAPPPPNASAQKQGKGGGRLKAKIVENKKEEFKELLGDLAKLAQSYAHLTPEQTQAFAQSAKVTQGSGSMELQGGSVVVKGDSMTVVVDAATFLIRQVKIDSLYENNPLKLTVNYQMIPQGPSYSAKVELSYPKKEVLVTVENSNYQRLRASAAPVAPVPRAIAEGADAVPAPDEPWPRKRVASGNTLIMYQPQVDEWKEFKTLDWRMAFSITPKGGKATVGALTAQAITEVDNDKRLVTIHDIKIEHTNFPSLEGDAALKMGELLRSFLPETVTISLERIVAGTPKKETAPAVALKHEPPRIFVSHKPAVLLDVDGEPVNVPIQNTNLEYLMNTSWRVIRDKADSRYYFLAGEQWLTAARLEGPWAVAAKLPAGMDVAAKDPHFPDLKDAALKPAKAGAVVPSVFYTTAPAEVIYFEGAPAYAPIQGTQLSYATNTVSYVFTYAKTKEVYYLTAGRWFSAKSLAGPWTFASSSLPEDFARIPHSSPAAQVLASVPGTDEAMDAVLMAQIPTTATVDPKAAAEAAKVNYDGDPKFAPVQGTSMQYATNTGEKVIKVGDVYYLCLQGVWFLSTTPKGPWQTAPSVPQEIYTIPASSPVYNVTYVTQVTTTSGVQASYTAGYTGAFVMGVAMGAVVCGGTGYYYPPYMGYYPGYIGYPHYYGTPYTYGAAAWHNSSTGRYGVSQTAYGPYGSATRSASYNPYTGTATRSASVATPYGRATVGQAYNPYTGAYGATKQGSNAYSQWGSSVVSKNGQTAYAQHYSDSRGTVGSVQGSGGGAAVGAAGAGGSSGFAGKTGSGDMYAGKDGNVYKNTGSGWQKYDNGGWNSVTPPAQPKSGQAQAQAQGAAAAQRGAQAAPTQAQGAAAAQRGSYQGGGAQTQNLQNEAASRQRGAQQMQRTQQRSAPSSGGGGARAGGGRRR